MIRISRRIGLLSLTAALLFFLAVGQARAQIGMGPGSFGSADYVGMGPGAGMTPYQGGWSPYGIDVTGWGTGYGTGWGFGYVNPYFGSGYGLGSYGESPYSLALARAQESALLASRYNLTNAQTVLAYQAANLYRQQAVGVAAQIYRENKLYRPYYGVATGRARIARRHGAVAVIPRERLFDAEGHVQWPASTPSGAQLDTARQEADSAIQKVFEEQKQNGRASVRSVVAAREKLAAFGGSALEQLRTSSPADAAGLEVFLYSLDRALTAMANTVAAPNPGRVNLTPENAPRTGGQVLKNEIEKNRKDETPKQQNPPRQP